MANHSRILETTKDVVTTMIIHNKIMPIPNDEITAQFYCDNVCKVFEKVYQTVLKADKKNYEYEMSDMELNDDF